MNDETFPQVETPATVEWATAGEDAEEAGSRCGLQGCGNPLPPPAIDEHGRRKGGRPSRYCSKAHADAASRARRARDTAAVADPLGEVRSIGEALLPGVRELVAGLATLEQRFAEAERRAFAHVAHAEAEADQARQDAAAAVTQAEQAERQRREALAAARDHQQERERVGKEADRIKREAEEVRAQAWEAVATHERARGQAEAAHAAGTAERDRLQTELGAAHAQQERERAEQARLAQALTATQTDLAQAHRELVEAHRELDQLRQQATQATERLGALEEQLGAERRQGRLNQARTQELESELRSTRDRLTEANTRLDAVIAAGVAAAPARPASPVSAPRPGGSAARHPIWLGRPARRPTASGA